MERPWSGTPYKKNAGLGGRPGIQLQTVPPLAETRLRAAGKGLLLERGRPQYSKEEEANTQEQGILT
eukprot:NODE_582_length_797_cov_1080.220588_g518_i0.p3 GENE.NODE_582_length_797_cov_1080.220588_g518_i0~~NODE_582_length_797_cov_1080.220588_g518_i0.p3  ORF type:complete len:67 (-),score=6.80 NODE_582_length_797_cov_1080.220588_g518_i0:457-657(-)